MKKLLMICILSFVLTTMLHAQNIIIKGRVVDENLDTLPDVSVIINDTVKVGKTDLNGFFQISIPFSVKNISFEFLGIEKATIKLADTCNEVEIVMMLRYTYDFITFRRIDKLRMKRFKKLPKLHHEAFEKGIFKTDKACYKQEFTPLYKKIHK